MITLAERKERRAGHRWQALANSALSLQPAQGFYKAMHFRCQRADDPQTIGLRR